MSNSVMRSPALQTTGFPKWDKIIAVEINSYLNMCISNLIYILFVCKGASTGVQFWQALETPSIPLPVTPQQSTNFLGQVVNLVMNKSSTPQTQTQRITSEADQIRNREVKAKKDIDSSMFCQKFLAFHSLYLKSSTPNVFKVFVAQSIRNTYLNNFISLDYTTSPVMPTGTYCTIDADTISIYVLITTNLTSNSTVSSNTPFYKLTGSMTENDKKGLPDKLYYKPSFTQPGTLLEKIQRVAEEDAKQKYPMLFEMYTTDPQKLLTIVTTIGNYVKECIIVLLRTLPSVATSNAAVLPVYSIVVVGALRTILIGDDSQSNDRITAFKTPLESLSPVPVLITVLPKLNEMQNNLHFINVDELEMWLSIKWFNTESLGRSPLLVAMTKGSFIIFGVAFAGRNNIELLIRPPPSGGNYNPNDTGFLIDTDNVLSSIDIEQVINRIFAAYREVVQTYIRDSACPLTQADKNTLNQVDKNRNIPNRHPFLVLGDLQQKPLSKWIDNKYWQIFNSKFAILLGDNALTSASHGIVTQFEPSQTPRVEYCVEISSNAISLKTVNESMPVIAAELTFPLAAAASAAASAPTLFTLKTNTQTNTTTTFIQIPELSDNVTSLQLPSPDWGISKTMFYAAKQVQF